MIIEVNTFEKTGEPILSFKDSAEAKYAFLSFGMNKAETILQNIDKIEDFVKNNKSKYLEAKAKKEAEKQAKEAEKEAKKQAREAKLLAEAEALLKAKGLTIVAVK